MDNKVFRSKLRGYAAAAVVFMVVPRVTLATVYYVDPATGSDANDGISAATPWLNPPGTRLADDSGFWSDHWGAVAGGNPIQCGDVLLLKGGATQTSGQGGAWRIDPDFYAGGCTSDHRITLRVATGGEWSGASGPFTLDGTGVVPTADPTRGFSDHVALIAVEGDVDFIELEGAGDGQRLTVVNSSDWLLVVACHMGSDCLGPRTGFRGDWLDLHNANDGFNIGAWNLWQVSNSVAYDIVHGPWQTGLNADVIVDQGGFVNVSAHDSGCGSVAAPTCTTTGWRDDLFFLVGGRSVWCENCTAYNGGERGFNTGVIQNAHMGGDYVYRIRNLVSYNNGMTCNRNGHWCAGAGIGISGNDFESTDVSRNYVVGAQLFGNGTQGSWAYGAGYLEIWQATIYSNGDGVGYGYGYGSAAQFDTTAGNVLLINSINTLQGTPMGDAFAWNNANGAEPQKLYTPTVLNSCWQPRADNSEPLGTSDGSGWPGTGTYATPPPWIDASNQVGLSQCDPRFVSIDPSIWANNDFHLQAGSSALDAGRFLLLADGAGTNAGTIAVRANGGSGDPRNFFIAPDSFLDAALDTIQIEGCGVVTIIGMTANTITFSPPCSWADGAGVHLPWVGYGPDMGALESGGRDIVVRNPTTGSCTGDCNGDGIISVDELLTMVSIALGDTPASACPRGSDSTGQLGVSEILAAVNNALNGCTPT